jgi:hypothetical protein
LGAVVASSTSSVRLFLLVITATARGFDPGALRITPLFYFTISRARIVKRTAKLPPAQLGKLVAKRLAQLAQAANDFQKRRAFLIPRMNSFQNRRALLLPGWGLSIKW